MPVAPAWQAGTTEILMVWGDDGLAWVQDIKVKERRNAFAVSMK